MTYKTLSQQILNYLTPSQLEMDVTILFDGELYPAHLIYVDLIMQQPQTVLGDTNPVIAVKL